MTTKTTSNDTELILTGLDGANPLAFLAALGVLRTLSSAWPEADVKMRWLTHGGAWRPAICLSGIAEPESLVLALSDYLDHNKGNPALEMADNLNLSQEDFRSFAQKFVQSVHASPDTAARMAVDFAAAFACDALVNESSKIQDTALRTMSGAGHQHFLSFMRSIVANTKREHLKKTLFHSWRYDDPIAGQSLRWDPMEDSRYALQWQNPSGDPSRNKAGTMLGANRLAIEGLPLFGCVPDGKTLRTVGFYGRGSKGTYWFWPIWNVPITIEVCRSLLSNPLLVNNDLHAITTLRAMGVQQVFLCQRITTGKFRSFTPARAVF